MWKGPIVDDEGTPGTPKRRSRSPSPAKNCDYGTLSSSQSTSRQEVREVIAQRLAEDLSESPRTPSPATIVAQSSPAAEAEKAFQRCPTPEHFPGHKPPEGLRVRDEIQWFCGLHANWDAVEQGRRPRTSKTTSFHSSNNGCRFNNGCNLHQRI